MVGLGVGVCVHNGANVFVVVSVYVGVYLAVGVPVGVNVGVCVAVGVGVGVSVGVSCTTVGVLLTDIWSMPIRAPVNTPARTSRETAIVNNLPTVGPTTEDNNAGTFNHSDISEPTAAVCVNWPLATLTYFLFPASLRAVIPTCFKRASRFKARVFSR